MKQNVIYLKKLTLAEVGETKAHVGGYIRLPNDFDYETFFQTQGENINGVTEIIFNAYNCNKRKTEENLRFAYFANSNKERRIPNLANLFKENDVEAGDIVKLESRQMADNVEIQLSFYKNKDINTSATNIYYVCVDDDSSSTKQLQCVNLPLQQIFYGAPGTGKSNTIKREVDDMGKACIRTTFHPDSDYSTFVGCYKPTTKPVPMYSTYGERAVAVKDSKGEPMLEDRIVYEYVGQAFFQAYVEAWKNYAAAENEETPKEQYLVIEEINRGNCAQIFGDLFQLLDRNDSGFSDYPIKADTDLKKQLAKAFTGLEIAQKDKINALYKNVKDVVSGVLAGDILLLPNNLYIWATMNTSDQSLFPIDSAFKRRWDWQYMPISEGVDNNTGRKLNWKIEAKIEGQKLWYDWWEFLNAINSQIEQATNSEDKKLGYFFCKANKGIIDAKTFVSKVVFYLWNDVFKDFADETGDLFKDADGSSLTFNKFYGVDGNGNPVMDSKVGQFLKNLKIEGVEPDYDSIDEEDDEEDDEEEKSNTKDYSRYSVNGEGDYPKRKIPTKIVELYIKQHPEWTATDVLNNLSSAKFPISTLSSSEHSQKLNSSNDPLYKNRYDKLDLANGESIFVRNQISLRRMNRLMAFMGTQNWGIEIKLK